MLPHPETGQDHLQNGQAGIFELFVEAGPQHEVNGPQAQKH